MSSPSPGTMINGWRVLDVRERHGRLGRAFFVSSDKFPGQTFVLKMLREDRLSTDPNTLQNEARRLRETKVPDHMPALLEEGEWHGLRYFVMERLACFDSPIKPKGYRTFCVLSCEALARLHADDIIHCDLTPLHIRWKNGHIAFIDYDNAHTHIEAAANTDHSIGTDPYIAPEVVKLGELTEKSDVYSLAVILLEHCPKKLEECFRPVLMTAVNPDPAARPTAARLAKQLRTCRAPHHRFKALVKWTALTTIILGSTVWCLNTLGTNFWMRDQRVRREHMEDYRIKAEFNEVLTYYQHGDYTNAIPILMEISNSHNSRTSQACRMLSECYRYGFGVKIDDAKCREYNERAKMNQDIERQTPGQRLAPVVQVPDETSIGGSISPVNEL